MDGVGLYSLLLFFAFVGASGKLKGGEDAVEPFGLLDAPLLINVWYAASWVMEALLGRVWSARVSPSRREC